MSVQMIRTMKRQATLNGDILLKPEAKTNSPKSYMLPMSSGATYIGVAIT